MLNKEKEEQEIESMNKELNFLKKQNEFLLRGYRAMNIVLDYQSAIVAILRTLNVGAIEIDDKLLNTTDEIRVHHTINNTTIIELVKKE